jgi:hypothetical protein
MPQRIRSQHTITIDAPIVTCFGLFTPAGEERWVDGWKPTYVIPADGHTEADMVFITGDGDERTVWMLIELDEAAHRLRYARVTPASRTGCVDVQCRVVDDNRTEVTVAYTLTALSPAGEQRLADYEGEAFVAMIEEWRESIHRMLETDSRAG